MTICPCGTGKDYSECCEPFIEGEKDAKTAEELLRARYTAYAVKKPAYVFDTMHPSKKKDDSLKTIERWAKRTEWLKLEILNAENGGPEDSRGIVEFVADYMEKGKRRKHHEIAEFKKEDGKWYFFDAKDPVIKQVRRQGPKIGRNDPCPCGSGKKYKKCCGR